jgi:hypothetical protein
VGSRWTGAAYDAAGKRNSSKVHARRSHSCEFCDETPRGNGGAVAHGRKHVRAGEAVEMVKWYSELTSPSRVFVPPGSEQEARFRAMGFTQERSDARDE